MRTHPLNPRHSRRPLFLVAFALLLAAGGASAADDLTGQSSMSSSKGSSLLGLSKAHTDDDFLPPDQAFQFNALAEAGKKHPIESVGARLRGMMPWMKKNRVIAEGA